jgi:hypothetical protein
MFQSVCNTAVSTKRYIYCSNQLPNEEGKSCCNWHIWRRMAACVYRICSINVSTATCIVINICDMTAKLRCAGHVLIKIRCVCVCRSVSMSLSATRMQSGAGLQMYRTRSKAYVVLQCQLESTSCCNYRMRVKRWCANRLVKPNYKKHGIFNERVRLACWLTYKHGMLKPINNGEVPCRMYKSCFIHNLFSHPCNPSLINKKFHTSSSRHVSAIKGHHQVS